jgi:phage gp29-like protein
MSDSTDPGRRPAAPPPREIASIASDPNRWFYGDRFPLSDPILTTRGAGKGLALYDELERDPQVSCELGKRRMALLGREWSVEAGADDARAAAARDLVKRALDGARFNQGVEKLLDALMKGLAVVEVMWQRRGAEILPLELRGRDPRRFAWHVPAEGEPELRLLSRAHPMDGVPVPARKFVVHRFGARYEDPWGLGLGSRLFWPVYFKRQGIGFWLSALEKFGQPTALGRYPAGASETEQDKLLAALQAIASEAGVIVPDGMVVELVEAKRAGTFEAYESLARYMDEDISKVILGQTLTTSAGAAGSRALGQVHNEVRLEISKGDADLLSDALNSSLVTWIVDLNLPGYASSGLPYPRVWWDLSEPEDLVARAGRDEKVRALGYRPTEEYIRDTYGEGWEAEPRPGLPPRADLPALFAEAGRRSRAGQGAMVPELALAEQLAPAAGRHTDVWLDELRRAVDEVADRGGTLQDVADAMLRLYPALATDGLAEVMAQALAVAHLAGRSEIADGLR